MRQKKTQLKQFQFILNLLIVILLVIAEIELQKPVVLTQTVPRYILPDDTNYQLAQPSTVRIVQNQTSGSGVIVQQQQQVYTVLTNWHVVANNDFLTIMTVDGQKHKLLQPPQQLGTLDLAVVQFQSFNQYQVATMASELPEVGEKVYAAGYPLYRPDNNTNTLAAGIREFRLTQGEISLIPPKSLPQGYNLGYTNEIEVGMSGGPIFNSQGFLIGINGRQKFGDPDFGIYTFEDGSEPTPKMLEKMVNSSWGIPITFYLQFVSQLS